MSKQVGAIKLQFHCDSWLVVSQVNGEFKTKDQRMVSYLKEVRILRGQFEKWTFCKYPGEVTVMLILWPLWLRQW